MNIKKLTIAWLYYDLLELYSDRGNIKILENICNNNGIELIIEKVSLNSSYDISNCDILFLGGGSDYAQNIVYKDLLKRRSQIEKLIENKGYIITICGGYQMFGKYYVDAKGNKIKGLEFFDFYTESGDKRCIGNIVLESVVYGEKVKIVGFENHGGQTKNVSKPFGKVIVGHGNEYKSEFEGYCCDFFLGTYLHGPLLPKNPIIVKKILETILKKKYNSTQNIDIEYLKYYKKACEVVIESEVKC